MQKCNLLLSNLHTRVSQLRKFWTLMSTVFIPKITNKLHAWTTIDSDQGFACWRSEPCLIEFIQSSIQCSSIICLYLDHLWRLLMHSKFLASKYWVPVIGKVVAVSRMGLGRGLSPETAWVTVPGGPTCGWDEVAQQWGEILGATGGTVWLEKAEPMPLNNSPAKSPGYK